METAQFEVITPEKAKEYLTHNKVNRHLSPKRIHQYADDMSKGNWQDNGESICFSENGNLIDGQHRLQAVVVSGKNVRFLVVRGIKNNISVFDLGRARDLSDSLIIDGMPRELAHKSNIAVCKLFYCIRGKYYVPSRSEIKAFLEKYSESLLKLSFLRTVGHRKEKGSVNVGSASFVLACLYALESGIDLDTITRFATVVRTGFYDSSLHEEAGIVCRNDIINYFIPIKNGGTQERVIAVYQIEKAIDDFYHKYPRKVSYKNHDTPVFSNNKKFKEI